MSQYEAHGRRMRQVICDTMADLLAEKPFLKITVRDIMERAQIQRATFYRYFRDKYEVAETLNRTLANLLAKGFFSSFYHGHGIPAEADTTLESRYARILYKMLSLKVENVNLRQNLSDAFLSEYMEAFPGAGEFEAFLAAQNFLSIVSWMERSNASVSEVRRYLQSDAQMHWLCRFYNVSPRSFAGFLKANHPQL